MTEQKTEDLFSFSWPPDSRHDYFRPDNSNNIYAHELAKLVRKHIIHYHYTQLYVVSPPTKIIKYTDGKHRNNDLTIIILWNNHYNLNLM